jgi:hypothetical protein
MKTVALVIGFILLALGVACFIPGVAVDGALFGFPVSMPLAIAFIITGAIGIMIGMRRKRVLVPPRGDGPDLRDLA